MAVKDVSTYQAKVGRVEGGDDFYMKSDGMFQFYNTEYAGRELELKFISRYTHNLLGSDNFSVGHLSGAPAAYGLMVLSAATGASLGTLSMPAASKGAWIRIDGKYLAGDANCSITTTSTTGLVLNMRSSDLSSFNISAAGFIEAFCETDGTWQIIDSDLTEAASS